MTTAANATERIVDDETIMTRTIGVDGNHTVNTHFEETGGRNYVEERDGHDEIAEKRNNEITIYPKPVNHIKITEFYENPGKFIE